MKKIEHQAIAFATAKNIKTEDDLNQFRRITRLPLDTPSSARPVTS